MRQKTKRGILTLLLLLFCVFAGQALMEPVQAEAAAKNGWVKSGKTKVYYQNGKKLKGFKKIKSDKYYFKLSNGKMIKNQWKEINHKFYYFGSNGKMARKRWIGNYYVKKNGVMATNQWVGKYFVGEDGKWIKNFKGGWYKIDGHWYYYTKKGVKKTGWLTYRGQKYYLNSNGVMVTKRTTIKKKDYYFSKSGSLKKSTWVKSGKWYYYANAKGVLNTKERMNTNSYSTATIIEYKTGTLNLRIEKHRNYGTDYWTAHIKIKNADQIVHAFSNGTYGGTRQTTSSAVKSNNAIIGINGSAFDYGSGVPSPLGMCIKDGKVYANYATSYTVMCILNDGTMCTAPLGVYGNYLTSNGVRDTFNFGPILLEDGNTIPFSKQGNDFSLVLYQDPRSAVGMVRPGEYVLLVADGRRSTSKGLNYSQMVSIFKSFGCTFAYNLDGGGSATLSYRGKVLNNPSDGSERACADFLLFTN